MATALESAGPAGGSSDVVAVAVAAQQHGLVVLDHQGGVLRVAKLWNDTESAEDADLLVGQLGAEAWSRACGSLPVPAFTITKLGVAPSVRA